LVVAPAAAARAEGAPPELAAVDQGPAPESQRPPIELIVLCPLAVVGIVLGAHFIRRRRGTARCL
jgi:hypothetical protein